MNRIRASVAAAIAVACLVTGNVVAHADPDAVAEAKAELDRIHQEASAIDQQIIEAHEAADAATAKLKTLSADLKAQETKVAALASQLGDAAVLQMHTDHVSLAAQLLTTTDAEAFLSGLGAMQAEVDRSNAGVQRFQLDQAKLTALRADAKDAEAELAKQAKAKEELAKEYDAKEATAQAVFDRLSAEEQARLAELEAQRLAEAEAAQAAAEARTDRDRPSRDGSSEKAEEKDDAPVETGSSDRAQAAVKYALSKVGSRYVWGTSGESTFDCSGLTSWAYRKVGINITRSSRGQWSSVGKRVSKSELRPGDLVFYYSPVSHVGLYIGGGKIVDAANPRRGVRVTSLDSMPFTGARRVVG
ncbi:MAG: C40 family peptidase [Tessaracoccus sp.]|uniref:C40 family peptidase n=1 Tax=Tessaracoccus sp. TaxID=1971211 RepID=UPI001EB670EF|nr:NlpC/P60 family protein [Tessaracoccus sp.]MBK7821074.1 C40 family peptidase [Tessaracoccus sp.]